MYIQTTDAAWEYLTNLPPHPHRAKPERVWNGVRWVVIEHEISAKGISSFLYSFFFNPNPSLPDASNYSQTYPYSILPESFIDKRPDDWRLFDLPESPPGTPLTFNRAYDFYKHQEKKYPQWSTGDATRQHKISFPHDRLKYITPIVDYWHIALTIMPRSPVEKFSALINAIGLQVLDHEYLHRTVSPQSTVPPIQQSTIPRKRKLRIVRKYNIPAPGQPHSPYTPYPYTNTPPIPPKEQPNND